MGEAHEHYTIKDSGKRAEFEGGMVRDTEEGKLDWSNLRVGPMPRRIVAHLTGGRGKYPDPFPGIPNWSLGRGIEVWLRCRASLGRHLDAYLAGVADEDHAAAIYFNINVAEFVRLFFTEEEEAQARAVENLQRVEDLREQVVAERAASYVAKSDAKREKQEDASLETPAQTGRRLLTLKADEAIREAVDGTGLDRQLRGAACVHAGQQPSVHLHGDAAGPRVGTSGLARGDFR